MPEDEEDIRRQIKENSKKNNDIFKKTGNLDLNFLDENRKLIDSLQQIAIKKKTDISAIR